MDRGSERKVPHIGTETRSKLLREAAVRNIGQWAIAWTSQVAWRKTALQVVNFFYRRVKCTTCSVLQVSEEKASANSVPAAAVIRRMQALSGFIGFKGCVGGMRGVAVKCIDITQNSDCEGSLLGYNWRWGTKAWVSNRIRYPGSPRSKRWILTVCDTM